MSPAVFRWTPLVVLVVCLAVQSWNLFSATQTIQHWRDIAERQDAALKTAIEALIHLQMASNELQAADAKLKAECAARTY